MRLESFNGSRRQADGSAALLGLRFPQFDDPAIACERAPDAYGAVLNIHVLPSQCQQLSLPHSGGNGEDVQGFEPVAVCRLKKSGRLFGSERTHLLRSGPWRSDRFGDVAWNHVPLQSLGQRLVQDGVHLMDRRGAESMVEPVTIEAMHVCGGELLEPDPAKCRP